jgi:hypothetical protein
LGIAKKQIKKTLHMYQVLDKDIINMEILPYLSVAKRGYTPGSQLLEIVNAILYKMKTSTQWGISSSEQSVF